MFSFLTKRLAATTGINSSFRSNALKVSSLVSSARRLKCDKSIQPFQKSCKMEFPKKKCEEPPCRPLEPCCPVDFTGCPVVKEDPCQIKPDCCGNERIARDPCNCKGARIWKKPELKLQKMPPFQSVWEYPADCCGNPCPELLPRFDTLYYEPMDKAKREYQQTWVECPKVQIRKRRVCCYDSTELPPICRRKKVECPISACAFDSKKLQILCSAGFNKRCPTIKSVCCLRGRYPPRCQKIRYLNDCKRRCCPYPAYSECCSPCPNPEKTTTECICKRLHSCLIYRDLKRKLTYDLPPPLPAWPPKMIPAR